MGINVHIYTVLGARLPYDSEFSEAHNKIYNIPTCPTLWFDGMGGEYIVIGTPLYYSGDARYGWDNYPGDKELEVSELETIEKTYKENFLAHFPDFEHMVKDKFKLVMFMHLT